MTLTKSWTQLVCRLALGVAGAAVPLCGQTAAPGSGRGVVVVDPAHGGPDHGASMTGNGGGGLEKDTVVALAASLRAALLARGLAVAMTREGEPAAGAPALSSDQRAEQANHLRPLACIVLHATPAGSGVNVVTSPLEASYDSSGPVPWESAQRAYVRASERLANGVGVALQRAKIPVVVTRAALRPLDNLMCPAVAVELSPLVQTGLLTGERTTPAGDGGYQRRVAEALATALAAWRGQAAGGGQAGGGGAP